jgi:hypothetical protein
VTVPVVNIGAVCVLVRLLLVNMKMAVHPDDFGIVRVIMVVVVMTMRVFVLDALVAVPMLVFFGRVQVDGEAK